MAHLLPHIAELCDCVRTSLGASPCCQLTLLLTLLVRISGHAAHQGHPLTLEIIPQPDEALVMKNKPHDVIKASLSLPWHLEVLNLIKPHEGHL